MIKTRLIRLLSDARKYVVGQVLLQIAGLLLQIMVIARLANILQHLVDNIPMGMTFLSEDIVIIAGCIILRAVCDRMTERCAHLASVDVKRVLRGKIYDKMLALGSAYRETISSAEASQMAVEGVEQLETYFGKYLSQFFYALIAPVILFFVIMRIDLKAAVVLLVAVPLIPIVIMIVMIVARKLLDKYFNIYYGLADHFLENLEGMTTLKIYEADEDRSEKMDKDAQHFRKITMKVLSMQLNSTAIMDIVAYGGSAVGIVVGLNRYYTGAVNIGGMLMIILLAAEFFLPMRKLGSYFHIGMNGMKASDRIFAFLDRPEPVQGNVDMSPYNTAIHISGMGFGYDQEREVLHDVNIDIPQGSFVSIVGASGSGKSTIAGILTGHNKEYTGSVTIGSQELKNIRERSLRDNLTLVSHDSYIFHGTVRENLLLANPDAREDSMVESLTTVNLWDELSDGLDTVIEENAANLSGGQKQRLAIARALIHDTPVYIFDEATSNIDMESEEMIMEAIRVLAKDKTVILISHRLANVVTSDRIFMLENGTVVENGTHEELMSVNGAYAVMYESQRRLETYSDTARGSHAQKIIHTPNRVTKREASVSEDVSKDSPVTSAREKLQGIRQTNVENQNIKTGPTAAEQNPGHSSAPQQSGRKRSGWYIMKRLLGLVKPLAPVMVLGIALGVAGYLCAIFITILAGRGIIGGLGTASGRTAFAGSTLSVVILVIAFARGFLHYGEQYCNHYIAFRLLALIRHYVFKALRKLCPAKLAGRENGNLVSIITSDIELLEVFYAHTISPIAIALVVSVIMTIFIGVQSVTAGVIAALGYAVVGILIPIWNGRHTAGPGLASRNVLGEMNSYMLESLYGLDEILQYDAGTRRSHGIDARSRAVGKTQRTLSDCAGKQTFLTDLCIQGFPWLVLIVTALQYSRGMITFGAMLTAVIAMMSSFGPVVALSALSNSLSQTLASGERVLDILDETPAVEENTEGNAVNEQADSAAEARNVTFSYENIDVFHDFNASIPAGQIVGIHGPSGCGKSTLLSLMMRFWDVQDGEIRIGNDDIRQINTHSLRQAESLVEQETWLFHDTIAANIEVGRIGASREEIVEAAKKANMHDFIMSLPNGYDTKVGELGDTLSGGERQRIGIARAFLHGGSLLLLDEPTSNLDSLNEGTILQSLAEQMKAEDGSDRKQTVVIVSHRQSTLGICDTVIDME